MLLHLLTAAVGTSQTPRDVGLESAISFLMIIVLPDLLQAAWDRAQPGREAASQNEVLRMFFDELARLDRAPRSAIIEFHAHPR